jgi:hypothetical protein
MSINKLKIGNKTITISEEVEKINTKKIIKILPVKIRSFSKSGAYIPLSQDYKNHNAYVIVLEDKND